MSPSPFFIFAGIWLGLLYASTVFSAGRVAQFCRRDRLLGRANLPSAVQPGAMG